MIANTHAHKRKTDHAKVTHDLLKINPSETKSMNSKIKKIAKKTDKLAAKMKAMNQDCARKYPS